jgi:predicted TIM-barrel fold metal-dependent hydrolase
MHTSRRRFVCTLAAASAGALVANRVAGQQPARTRRVDFHHHFQLAEIMAVDARAGGAPPMVPWSLESDLEDMDRSGTETAILSGFVPTRGTAEVRRKAARTLNEFSAQLRSDRPTRFGNFAALPLRDFDNDGCLREIEYAADTLQVDGFFHMTSYDDAWAGDDRWAPVYEELNRRKAIVHVHPQGPACCGGLSIARKVPNEGAMIEFGADTTRVIASLVFSGFTQRYPDIRWVFAHSGGVMPFIIERFFQGGTSAEILPGIVTKGQDGGRGNAPPGDEVLRQLRSFHYDTAQSSNPVAMEALKKVVGVTQILFGTDFWYRTAAETSRGLVTSRVFTPAELQAIDRGNAERLIPRLRNLSAQA